MVGERLCICQPLLFKKIISYITNTETKENIYPVNEKTFSVKDVLYVDFIKH